MLCSIWREPQDYDSSRGKVSIIQRLGIHEDEPELPAFQSSTQLMTGMLSSSSLWALPCGWKNFFADR